MKRKLAPLILFFLFACIWGNNVQALKLPSLVEYTSNGFLIVIDPGKVLSIMLVPAVKGPSLNPPHWPIIGIAGPEKYQLDGT